MVFSRISEFSRDDGPAPERRKPPVAPDGRLFVPAHPRYPSDPEVRPGIGFELLRLPGGDLMPVAFTELDLLVRALGEAQPWVAVRAGWYAELMRSSGLGRLHIDPEVAPEARSWTPDAVRTYAEAAR
ncbi:SAV_915 family protein [Streptomyces sp. NPDC057654]|uniref:SAV_915 family protein n=1 Tax=Streptomyces sp. NPDC057654 TaxID=3346196 RepID=UPI0036CD7E7A